MRAYLKEMRMDINSDRQEHTEFNIVLVTVGKEEADRVYEFLSFLREKGTLTEEFMKSWLIRQKLKGVPDNG